MTTPDLYWDAIKFAIPFLIALFAWGWRVEIRLSNHAMLISKITETLDRVGKTIDEWTDVKEARAERLARLEAKIDLMIARKETHHD